MDGGFMTKSRIYEKFKFHDVVFGDDMLNKIIIKSSSEQISNFAAEKKPVFFEHPSGQLIMENAALESLLIGRSSTAKKFAMQRLKLLFHRCSKDVRERRISIEAVNRLSTFCLEIIPLIENASIVMPTAAEFSALIDWYFDMQLQPQQKPSVVLTTVCPDYPYDWKGTKAMYKEGLLGDDIGLIGESIMNTGPLLLDILAKTLNIPIAWIVGYAEFEAKPSNLKTMDISAKEFRDRLKKSASKLQQKITVPVAMLPEAVGLTIEQFDEIRKSFMINDFIVQRKGMDALSSAVDARDWASIFFIANKLNAIIVDGASVYMGRKAYKKAKQILHPANHTPSFYCVTPYMGFAG